MDLKVEVKHNLQNLIVQCFYFSDKERMVVVLAGGLMKMFDTGRNFECVRTNTLIWGDVTSLQIRYDDLMIVGHTSGIIYSQNIRTEIKVTDMQLHNYHMTPIL